MVTILLKPNFSSLGGHCRDMDRGRAERDCHKALLLNEMDLKKINEQMNEQMDIKYPQEQNQLLCIVKIQG